MSSPDRSFRRLSLVLALAASTLSACTEMPHPLYGAGTGASEGLRKVDIAAVQGRVGQQVRNELVFGFYGGAGEPSGKPAYRLELNVTSIDNAVGVERFDDLPAAYVETITASWTLTEVGTGATITTGTSFAQATFDFSPQRFADVRAKRDAENRAATVVAGDIRNKLAVWFASHH